MKLPINFILIACLGFLMTSCVSNKKYQEMQANMQEELDVANSQLGKAGEELNKYMNLLSACEQEKARLTTSVNLREEQIRDLRFRVGPVD